MKRRIVALFLCMMIGTACVGCGNEKSDVTSTETAVEETPSVNSVDIEYDVNEYVTLGEYKGVEVTLNEADYAVTEDQINTYAQQMVSYYCPYIADETKTTVEADSIVDVNYVGKKDGVAFEGGTAENQMIDVANNSNATTKTGYIEGFTAGLVGAKVGDTVDCDVTFPENYQSADLAGQQVTFTFTINSIGRSVTLEDIDDQLVFEYFQTENVDKFMSEVKTFLEAQAETQKKTDIRTAVINTITEKSEVKGFPEGLLEARVDEYIAGFEKTYCADGTSLDDFLTNSYQTTYEEFEKEISTMTEENLRQELVLEAIVEKEKVEFDEEEFTTYVNNLVTNGNYENADKLYEAYGSDLESGKSYLQKVYLQHKACDIIEEAAKITYTSESVEETTEEVK